MTDLLIKLATRSRPKRAIDTIRRFASMAEGDVRFLVSIDHDDRTMNAPDVISEMVDAGQGADVDVRLGTSRGKIHAINRDLEGQAFDILIGAADDMVPVVDGYDRIIAEDMDRLFPNLDGALHYNDGNTGEKLNTLPVMGFNLFAKFGYLYHPCYWSLWADNEYQDVLRAMNRLPYIDNCIIEHCHPYRRNVATVAYQPDPLLKHTERWNQQDKETYRRRKRVGFEAQEILLSICICTIESRRSMLAELLNELNRQINSHPQVDQIETLIDRDGGEKSVGAKRNELLDRAIGRFVVFIDDDDMVSGEYVEQIIAAINGHPDADCVALEGKRTVEGKRPTRFATSLSCGRYYEKDGVHYRTPNHVSPVRIEHARQCRFPERDVGEDTQYAERLMQSGLLISEAPTEGVLYHYRFDPKTSTSLQARRRERSKA